MTRRSLVTASAAAAATSLILPAQASGLAPTPTMRGGANNYLPGAPIVERIGGYNRRARTRPAQPRRDFDRCQWRVSP
ncbi:hypothetical protein RD1_1722 [Roseobacter denitrificans OCh 114]|uniref:Uncharacterized protein n=1 Tax=Roseobacter denitrificans (strain ATCC 33942 / OCh 114) TaxID=375451 RepID=Q169J9_ROSDO|nr:hypothetical protein RD1_1722 [Roseobacter denitrificans OCh 114]